MGTVLKQKNKEVKKRISRYGILLMIAAALGFSVLAYQAVHLISGGGFKRLNFDVGALWNSDLNNAVNEPIEEADIITEFIVERKQLRQEQFPSKVIPKDQFAHGIKSITPKFVKEEPSQNKVLQMIPFETNLVAMDLLDISTFGKEDFTLKYLKQLEQEYIFNPNLEAKRGKWFIGFSFAPSFSYRTFKYRPTEIIGVAQDGNTRYTYGMTESFRDGSDKAISTFYTGIDLGINIKEKWSIFTGLYYSVYGESISVSGIYEDDLNLPNAVFYEQTPLYYSPENAQSSSPLDYENRYSYFEIPVQVAYELLNMNKSKLSIELGAFVSQLDHVSALIYDFETDYYYWLPQNDLEIYRSNTLGASAGISISQFISPKVEVLVNPQFKMNLSSTFEEAYPVDQRQYSTGLRLGIKRHFKP
ncbi:MAG: hypothetical protein JXR19_01355 [Bacteroidia bacterium]